MKNLIPIFLILFLITSCRKDDEIIDTLPPITSNGSRTFGFMFNDQVWINTPKVLSTGLNVSYIESYGFTIDCIRDNKLQNNRSDVAGFLFKHITEGVRELSEQAGDGVNIAINNPDGTIEYAVLKTGTLKISRFDKAQRIISGEFQAEVEVRNTGAKATITQGRFDVKY